jgi:hypothetical protein
MRRQAHGQRGAHTAGLGRVSRTSCQQGKNAFDQLVKLLRSARPILLEIIPVKSSP